MQVGEAFAENKTVTVAKMDATTNDVPSSKFSVSDVKAEVINAYPCAMFCFVRQEITVMSALCVIPGICVPAGACYACCCLCQGVQ